MGTDVARTSSKSSPSKATSPDSAPRLGLRRHFTSPGLHPYDEVAWERRSASIAGEGGQAVFEQDDVEIPKPWSQLATNVVASKYFRGAIGSPEREWSVRQLFDRVVKTLREWGEQEGYLADVTEADTFESELTHLLVHQKMAFNSPVWFNMGLHEHPQCSACQPWHALISTPEGMVPIGRIVEDEQIGREVYDAHGVTRVVAVKSNGRKPVMRIKLRNGAFVEATPDHVVKAVEERRAEPQWMRVDELRVGMRMHLHPHRARVAARPLVAAGVSSGVIESSPEDTLEAVDELLVAEAALAGWLQADGFVGRYEDGTNRSLTVEFMTANDDEHAWVLENIEIALPHIHRHIRDVPTQDPTVKLRRIRCYGEELREFVDSWDLMARGVDMRVPARLWTASHAEVGAYLRSVFQADGYCTVRRDNGQESGRVGLAVIGERWTEDIQILLGMLGIYSRRLRKREPREDRHDLHEVAIGIGSERARFAELVGFVSAAKQRKLLESLGLQGAKVCPDLREEEIVAIEPVGVQEVYDIQTESGEYLTNSVAVHNCFILSVEDTMDSILSWIGKEGIIFKGGSGSGINLSKIRSSRERLSGGGTASGPVSFMRGADSCAGAIKSGGTTRRAAKMVILDVDHPDIQDFVQCKANEEKKAWALGEMGYDMGLNGEAWQSIQFQNANNSVRVTDEFMLAVEAGGDWHTRAVTTRETLDTHKARDLMKEIAEAAWVCGDPGMQYDTTINRWHTCPNSGRISASNPCSEYMHLDDSACNLASLNLMKFIDDEGTFLVDDFRQAVDVTTTAMDIIVTRAGYPTEKIAENARAFRQLGLGYANLGALLMSRGLPYDSDAGRSYAGAVTALMTGRAYEMSTRLAERKGPFAGYQDNAKPMQGVIRMHQRACEEIREDLLPEPDVLTAAREAWKNAADRGAIHGFRNSQASVLAPTGTIGFLMDCDTTGVEPDIALVKYKKLVGGGMMKIVNQTVPRALRTLGYGEDEVSAVVQFVDEHETIEGAPGLKDEHLAVFDCAFTPLKGSRSIHYRGHILMMGAVQPFISGAISKCVRGDTLLTTAEGLVRIGSLHRGERPDSFRDEQLKVASLDGVRQTDAFYYGGVRATRKVMLRSGQAITGTPNHRLLVATDDGLMWRHLEEVEPGDYVALQYGTEMWAVAPAEFAGFAPSMAYGSQKAITVPAEMTEDLAFLLGAYASEGHTARSNWTVRITNSVPEVLDRVAVAFRSVFGLEAKIVHQPDKCPEVQASSKTLVEFFEYLGCGSRASSKRIPDAVLCSPRPMMLAFLQGLALDAYVTTGPAAKWAICLDSPGMLDDLQAVFTNLGVVHSRIAKLNRENGKTYDEVYAAGRHAQRLVELVPFPEPDKAARAAELARCTFAQSTADVVPVLSGRDLYDGIPKGKSGRYGYGHRKDFAFLLDERTTHTSRATLERLATIPGVELPQIAWDILFNNLYFSAIESVEDAGFQEVYDLSVPGSHAFVGNGIVNHNTVNMPNEATPEEISAAYMLAWKAGVKALAIYRDGSKRTQPLSTGKAMPEPTQVARPVRRKLPDTRTATTHHFRIADYDGYITAGMYEDGSPGEVFMKMAKQGSTVSGLMDSLAICMSLALQYGVPLQTIADKLSHMRFDPSGFTGNPEIPMAKSIVDYVVRWLASQFLSEDEKRQVGILTQEIRDEVRTEMEQGSPPPTGDGAQVIPHPAAPANGNGHGPVGQTSLPLSPQEGGAYTFKMQEDGAICGSCGWPMIRSGTCYKCENCGSTSGCS